MKNKIRITTLVVLVALIAFALFSEYTTTTQESREIQQARVIPSSRGSREGFIVVGPIVHTYTPTPVPTPTSTPSPVPMLTQARVQTSSPPPVPPPKALSSGTKITVKASAYNGSEPGGGGFTTIIGTRVRPGVVAVDWLHPIVPLGTRLLIAGRPGEHIVEDTGDLARYGIDVDIWMSLEEADQWGTRTVTITILN